MFRYQRCNGVINAKAFPEPIEKPAGAYFARAQELKTLCTFRCMGGSIREDRSKACYEAFNAFKVYFFA